VAKQAASRALAGALVIGLIILGLWQAGVLFAPSQETNESVTVLPPDTSVEAPNPRGLTVGLREGNLAPNFEFSAYDGSRQKLSDYRGRAVFLNFWATWCGPCRAELVDMEATLRQYAGRELAILGVNNGETYARGESYIREIGVELTAFVYDPDAAIVSQYGLLGMPTSYFIDRDGIITRTISGQVSLKSMQSNIDEALAGYKPRN